MRHLISALSLVILFASFAVAPVAAHYADEGCSPGTCGTQYVGGNGCGTPPCDSDEREMEEFWVWYDCSGDDGVCCSYSHYYCAYHEACDIGMDQQAEDCADPITITSTQRATMEAEIAQATSVEEIGSILTNYGFEFVRTVTLEEYQQELQSDQGHEYQEHTH